MIDKFAKEIVSCAKLFTFKVHQIYKIEKAFFLLSISRPGLHLPHTHPALLESPFNVQQQLLDFNSFNINLLVKTAHFGNFVSFDILEKYIFMI